MPLLPINEVEEGRAMAEQDDNKAEVKTEDKAEPTKGGPLDLDGDGKQSSQETAIGVALVVVGGALAAYLLYLSSTGQVTEETLQPLLAVLAWITGREGVKRLTGV